MEKYNELLSSAADATECRGVVHRAMPWDPAVSHALVIPADAGPDVNKARGGQAWA